MNRPHPNDRNHPKPPTFTERFLSSSHAPNLLLLPPCVNPKPKPKPSPPLLTVATGLEANLFSTQT
ncbi:hypothetical protein COLO4_32067 [Corchorus olitorius]|uniref:Uncharacterized protein n=1 Tax=Corchorus olitorius TaxID=93759 RepID=A0A1R3H1V8_9ROSI|nr:hypothetical protein COLO4_32067 [Corchorus olitorius]